MEKSKVLQIYNMTHKMPEYGLIDDETHTPLEVGKQLRDGIPNICKLTDRDGINISSMNDFFHECTGIFWVWKNVKDVEYVGIEHYRRRWVDIDEKKVSAILADYDIICLEPFILGQSIYKHYQAYHSPVDIEGVKTIISKYYPDYMSSWVKYIENDGIFYPCNMVIMKKNDFDKMCEFIFNILFTLMNGFRIDSSESLVNHVRTFSRQIGSHNVEWQKYQMGIGGYLFERLVTLYIRHNFEKIYLNKMINMEQ